MNIKKFSGACERNAAPILAVLQQEFADVRHVLEIGSGTGQHAVFMAEHLPHVCWQPSDLPIHHASIQAWMDEQALPNVLPPLALDMAAPQWPLGVFDAVFTSNTCHIMSWEQVQTMFEGVARLLPSGGVLCIYGPFNLDGRYTSESNARFDEALKAQGPHMGLRDLEQIQELAGSYGLIATANHEMPANNRLLVWHRE